jgi:hypothetical protein
MKEWKFFGLHFNAECTNPLFFHYDQSSYVAEAHLRSMILPSNLAAIGYLRT